MSRIRYRNVDIDLLARIMRAEAVGEGKFGMQLVGNVVVNRVVATCGEFQHIDTVYGAVFQRNQFEGTKIDLFKAQATGPERKMALNCIKFWRAEPAYASLFFQNPGRGKKCRTRFWGPYVGKFKNHCFYEPDSTKNCSL